MSSLLLSTLFTTVYAKENVNKHQDLIDAEHHIQVKGVTSESIAELLQNKAIPAILILPGNECIAYGQLAVWQNSLFLADSENTFKGAMSYEEFLESMKEKKESELGETMRIFALFGSHSYCLKNAVFVEIKVKMYHKSKNMIKIIKQMNQDTNRYGEQENSHIRTIINENNAILQQYVNDNQHEKSEIKLLSIQVP